MAWILPTSDSRRIYPHLFSKDYSLVWRSPSHFIRSENENWMGKGDVRWVLDAEGEEILATFEETTNLPLEIQGALDDLTRRSARPRNDLRAVGRLLRRAPDHRLEPYEDFAGSAPAGAGEPAQPDSRAAGTSHGSRAGTTRLPALRAGI